MTSAGVKVKEKKTKTQENLLTLALPNQSNAVIYYITSAFRFSSLTQKEKNENRPRRYRGSSTLKHSPQFFVYRVSPQCMSKESKNMQQEQNLFHFFNSSRKHLERLTVSPTYTYKASTWRSSTLDLSSTICFSVLLTSSKRVCAAP